MKNNSAFLLKTTLFLIAFFVSIPVLSTQAQLPPLPTLGVNDIIPTVVNTGSTVTNLAPTVNSLLPNTNGIPVVPTVINSTNNINVFPQPTTQTFGNTSSRGMENGYSGTSTYYSNTTNSHAFQQSQAANDSNTPRNRASSATIGQKPLFLTKANTASGRIILTKDITDVIFGPDSLSNPGMLTFIMPPERNSTIIFHFGEFLQNDPGGARVFLPQAIRMEQTVGKDNVAITLPAGESLSLSTDDCGDDIWDGTITGLTLLSQNMVTLPGKKIGLPIEIGRSDCRINLSKQANITFTGEANAQAAYRLQNQENFTEIPNLCPITNQKECYANNGRNLVVKTYHFTQFTTFANVNVFESFLMMGNNKLILLIAAIILAIFLVLIFSNLSVLKRMTGIEENNKKKTEYVSLASHELRTPMTAIKGWLSLILHGDYGPVKRELQKPLQEINSSTQHSLDLVNNMLDVSKIESGKISLDFSSFPIDGLVSEVITSLQPLAREKGLTLEANIPGTIVRADKEKTREIITNLIANALKYTDTGSVSTTTKETKDKVTLLVMDTGPGIPEEEQDRLFQKFGKVNTSTAKKVKGTGLGLYIAKKLAEKMGGDVWLEKSEKGVGSTFAFSLKLA
jgi:signal transduction histidine kinase